MSTNRIRMKAKHFHIHVSAEQLAALKAAMARTAQQIKAFSIASAKASRPLRKAWEAGYQAGFADARNVQQSSN